MKLLLDSHEPTYQQKDENRVVKLNMDWALPLLLLLRVPLNLPASFHSLSEKSLDVPWPGIVILRCENTHLVCQDLTVDFKT